MMIRYGGLHFGGFFGCHPVYDWWSTKAANEQRQTVISTLAVTCHHRRPSCVRFRTMLIIRNSEDKAAERIMAEFCWREACVPACLAVIFSGKFQGCPMSIPQSLLHCPSYPTPFPHSPLSRLFPTFLLPFPPLTSLPSEVGPLKYS